jgi:hypothetical protein
MSDHIVDADKMVSDLEATAREIIAKAQAKYLAPPVRYQEAYPCLGDDLPKLIAEAIQAVREADAKVASNLGYPMLAAAIRNQGVR